ncbi:hypothetical protein [Microbacterium sp.]|uniref:hypothetical protein n=1 Tax=Microbacterium sp. TaxID=51671 RepID=UPI0025CF60EC|nr:hypothetical protein [Microbacterium sp.]
MTTSLMILIAGPYASGTNGDPDLMAQNLARLEEAAWPIFRAGHVPMIGEWVALPVLSSAGATGAADPLASEVMYPTAERLLQHCDAVLRLPGASRGADQDVAIARRRGIPVYTSLDEIPGIALAEPEASEQPGASFLVDPEVTPDVQAMYDEDLADDGFVWNLSRLWAHQPGTQKRLYDLMLDAFAPSRLSVRQRAILVVATAATLRDSYCSFAWGGRLARYADAATAASVLTGSDAGLTAQEAAMAAWARRITTDPNATTPADVDRLREVGLDDDQVFAITVFVGLRIAMATVDGALGARPDADLVAALPAEVRAVVGYGRQPLSA